MKTLNLDVIRLLRTVALLWLVYIVAIALVGRFMIIFMVVLVGLTHHILAPTLFDVDGFKNAGNQRYRGDPPDSQHLSGG